MTDREKVIKALETCRDQDNPPGYRFTSCVDDCPYHGNGCARKLKEDAIALLKQEAVEPFSDDDGGYWCSSCHEDIVWHQKFCSNCGRPVLWKGR